MAKQLNTIVFVVLVAGAGALYLGKRHAVKIKPLPSPIGLKSDAAPVAPTSDKTAAGNGLHKSGGSPPHAVAKVATPVGFPTMPKLGLMGPPRLAPVARRGPRSRPAGPPVINAKVARAECTAGRCGTCKAYVGILRFYGKTDDARRFDAQNCGGGSK